MKPGTRNLAVFLLFFTGALAAGWWTASAPQASFVRDARAAGPNEPPMPLRDAQAPSHMAWPVYLVVSGQAHDADAASLALPTGTRFNLRATPVESGELVIRAGHEGVVNSTPLWRGQVTAGRTINSPAFRVEGRLGMEKLELTIFRDGRQVGYRVVSLMHVRS